MPDRRQLFVLAGLILLPGAGAESGSPSVLVLCCMPLVMLIPALLMGRPDGPGTGEADADGNGGGGGPPPPRSPDRPWGGVPLPDADAASQRLRDHGRARWTQRRRRAPARPHRPPRPRVR